jgi:hypothetical protein
VKGERTPAGVTGLVAPTAPEKPEAARDRERNRDPVVAEAGDLGVLVDSGDEEDHDGGHQGHQEQTAEDPADESDVQSRSGPPESREGLAR